MYICICNAVTERQIHASVERGSCTLSDLQFDLGVATCCGCCAETAQSYLPQAGAATPARCESATVSQPCPGHAEPRVPPTETPAFPVHWTPLPLSRAA